MDKTEALLALAGLGVGFGAWALYLGYNNVVISSVFGLLGAIGGGIGGYLIGQRQAPIDKEA